MRLGWRLAGLGLELVSEVAAGLLIGYAVDWYLGTTRWTAVGGIAGIAVGLAQFIRVAFRIQREMGPVPTRHETDASTSERSTIPADHEEEG